MNRLVALALFAPLALSACDVALTQDETAYDTLSAETTRLRAAYAGVPVTTAVQMPLFGNATYDGTAVMTLDTPTRSSLIGEAAVIANFSTDRVFGTFDNFVGSLNGAPVQTFAGLLTTTNGEIDVSQSNFIQADMGGVLTGGGNVIGVDGAIIGNFLGPRAPFVPAALEAKATNTTDFTVNGLNFVGGMSIIAED